MRIEYHRTLVADHVRNQTFFRALKAAIVPGRTVVADIGTGTGLLGLVAARLGAKRVYMYETAAVGAVAEQVLKANRAEARVCELIAAHSKEMIDPPLVDLVVSETLGNYAFEENMIATLADARRRHLAPGGMVIPRAVTQHVAPVVSDRIHRELAVWDEVGLRLGLEKLDLSTARDMSFNNAYVRSLEPSELLDGGRSVMTWDTVALDERASSNRKGEATWRLLAPTTIYGFAVWWSAELIQGVSLTTAPGEPRTHWEQLYMPMATPIEAAANDGVSISIRSRSSEEGGTHLAWTGVHCDPSGKRLSRQAFDLDAGYLP
jgi:protein arginine N-methyltransferase 1